MPMNPKTAMGEVGKVRAEAFRDRKTRLSVRGFEDEGLHFERLIELDCFFKLRASGYAEPVRPSVAARCQE